MNFFFKKIIFRVIPGQKNSRAAKIEKKSIKKLLFNDMDMLYIILKEILSRVGI